MGLTHDIGKVLLIKALDGILTDQKSLDSEPVLRSIQEAHADFGSALLSRWKFPDVFVRVAKMHDDPTLSPATQKEILVVHLANILTRTIGFSPTDGEEVTFSEIESAKLLEITPEILGEVSDELKTIMQDTKHIF